MLGLGSALTTGSVHEQMYSAIFDGTGDYINTADTFQSTFRGSFSWSFWVKLNDGQPSANITLLGSKNTNSEDVCHVTVVTDGTIRVRYHANYDPCDYTTDAAVFSDGANDWKHVCVTVTKTTNTAIAIYVDGAVVAGTLTNAVAEAAHAAWTSTLDVYIGGLNSEGSAANMWVGNIDEVALWNVALDADAVTAIYNSGKPFDLNYDRGNYDNSSALVAYWRMGNGTNDDKVNGVIFDQTAPTIGANLVPESSFETVTNWTAVTASGSTSALDTSFSNSGSNSWKLVVDGTDTNLGVISDAITVEANTAYKVSWWSYVPSANNSKYVQVTGYFSSGNNWRRLGAVSYTNLTLPTTPYV